MNTEISRWKFLIFDFDNKNIFSILILSLQIFEWKFIIFSLNRSRDSDIDRRTKT